MGVIQDGTIAGVLPESEAFAVHYPGYPSSTSRAVETLGGAEEIAKRRSSSAKYIELRFRPDDPYGHPTFGDLRTGNSFLLKISKEKSCSGVTEGSGDQAPAQLCADVVARISEAYHFDGMADYQYVLPVHAAKSKKKKKRRWAEAETSFKKDGLMDFEQEDLLMLVPPLFSLKDIPEDIVLKAPSSLIPKHLQKGVVEQWWETDIEPCLALPFEIENIPEKVCWEDNICKDSVEWEYQMAVSKLFDEKPIWPRQSIYERLVDDGQEVSNHQLRRLLYRSGYYFATGPFGKFWIKKGYDPRRDSESQIYQKVDFRMPGPVRGFATAIIKNRLSTRWKDMCKFQDIPSKTFTCLQFLELEDEYIQQEIRKPAQKKICTHSTGWLSRSMLDILRLHVKIRILSILDNAVATNLIKTTRKQIEKVKTELLYGEPDPDEEGDQHINEAKEILDEELDPDEEDGPSPKWELKHCSSKVARMKSCNLQPVRNVEEEPREVEDDEDEEDEEELDEFELPSVEAGDGEFSSNGASYNVGENISDDYLQEILNGFHSKQGNLDHSNVGLHVADTSDGEYQIFEQDSDYDDYLDD